VYTLAEVGVFADEDVPVHVTPDVEATVAFGLDVAAEADALARHHVPATDAELDGALPTDEHVTVGDEVVFLDSGPVGNL
jgi:hypothetical protein